MLFNAGQAFVRKITLFVQHVLTPVIAAAATEEKATAAQEGPGDRATAADQVVGGIVHPVWGGDGWHRWSERAAAPLPPPAAVSDDDGGGVEGWGRLLLPGGLDRVIREVAAAREQQESQLEEARVGRGGEALLSSPLPAVIFLGTKRSVRKPHTSLGLNNRI